MCVNNNGSSPKCYSSMVLVDSKNCAKAGSLNDLTYRLSVKNN